MIVVMLKLINIGCAQPLKICLTLQNIFGKKASAEIDVG